MNVLTKATNSLSDVSRYVTSTYRSRIFKKALRNFDARPWESLHADSDSLSRLIDGWGSPDWSGSEEFLAAVIDEFSMTDGVVLECGSGLSTIVLGILADITGREVLTLEHNAERAAKVSVELDLLEIDSVHVSVKPLRSYGAYSWYDTPLELMPRNFALVICNSQLDSSDFGRGGMLPVMREYLDGTVSILVNDPVRDDEGEMLRRWSVLLGASVEKYEPKRPYAALRVRSPRMDGSNISGKDDVSITVGIPAFNSGETIGQSIDSVLSQSFLNLELLISDNLSDDTTQKECLERVRRDSRVHYYRQKNNIGVFENYNALFLMCKSKYFKWQSSSDWCDDELINVSIDILESNPDVVLAYSTVFLVDENGELEKYTKDFELQMADPSDRFVFLIQNIQLCNVINGVIRSSALRSTNLTQPFSSSDVVLLAELALRGKFVLIPDPLWYRRMTAATASKFHSAEQSKEFFRGSPSTFDKYVTWKIMFALFVAVFRSGVGVTEQFKCVKHLLRMVYWSRASLYREVFS